MDLTSHVKLQTHVCYDDRSSFTQEEGCRGDFVSRGKLETYVFKLLLQLIITS